VKPHSPPTAPKTFYDLWNVDDIPLPVNFAPRPTVPDGFPKASIRPRNADLFIGRDASEREAKEMIRAYLASTAWMDWNVGRVMAELDRLGLRDDTIVVFWGDHGYQLGERGKWSKRGRCSGRTRAVHRRGAAREGTAERPAWSRIWMSGRSRRCAG
jgi:arylsulfatase A-like enzyme